jgi:hypothetical protein
VEGHADRFGYRSKTAGDLAAEVPAVQDERAADVESSRQRGDEQPVGVLRGGTTDGLELDAKNSVGENDCGSGSRTSAARRPASSK